jgi:hypothetical protein
METENKREIEMKAKKKGCGKKKKSSAGPWKGKGLYPVRMV